MKIMTFTTPCFVRVENVEERQKLDVWLRGIGRRALTSKNQAYVVASVDSVLRCNLEGRAIDTMVAQGYIDCGADVGLFKALAAMNDENDREQWFTDDIHFEKSMLDVAGIKSWESCYHTTPRKATAEEIIEHFKNR